MPNPVVVRRAVPEDFDALVRAVRGRGRGGSLDRRRGTGGYASTCASPSSGSSTCVEKARFVAERDGLLVGELYVGRQMGVADLGMLVRDGHRRTGVGSALVDACVEWCRASRVHKVTLHVFPHNEAAIALYRKCGFTEEGRLRPALPTVQRRALGRHRDGVDPRQHLTRLLIGRSRRPVITRGRGGTGSASTSR